MSSSWISGPLYPMTGILIRKDLEACIQEGHSMKTGAETGVMRLRNTKDRGQHQKPGESHRTDPLPEPPQGA